jgi:hypothetical protein
MRKLTRYGGLLLVAALPACSSGASAPGTSPTPTLTVSPPQIALTHDVFLDVQLLRPSGWVAHRVRSSAKAGNVNYVAPGRRGTVYVEENDCAACVDAGLVMHGHRNGVTDPNNALASYFPTSTHRIDAYNVAFTAAANKPYGATGKLVVTHAHGTLTGYVIVIVTLPSTESGVAAQILASVRTS